MAYDDLGRYVHTRILSDTRDPAKASAESFVRSCEDFLYNTESPVYADTDFLAWAIAKYDASKQGSGRPWDVLDYLDSKDSIDYLKPPFVSVSDEGIEFRVKYTLAEQEAGLVPRSYDGTPIHIYENHVEQVIRPADVFQDEEN